MADGERWKVINGEQDSLNAATPHADDNDLQVHMPPNQGLAPPAPPSASNHFHFQQINVRRNDMQPYVAPIGMAFNQNAPRIDMHLSLFGLTPHNCMPVGFGLPFASMAMSLGMANAYCGGMLMPPPLMFGNPHGYGYVHGLGYGHGHVVQQQQQQQLPQQSYALAMNANNNPEQFVGLPLMYSNDHANNNQQHACGAENYQQHAREPAAEYVQQGFPQHAQEYPAGMGATEEEAINAELAQIFGYYP